MFNIENRNFKKKVFGNHVGFKTLAALLTFFSLFAFSFFSTGVFAPSSTDYNASLNVVGAGGRSNSTNFNNTGIEIGMIGGKTNSSRYNVTYGILAATNEYPVGTTIVTTTTISSDLQVISQANVTATVTNNTSTVLIQSVVPSGGEIKLKIPEGVIFDQISFTVNSTVSSAKVEVSKTSETPSQATFEPTGTVFSFLQITLTNVRDDQISSAKLKFKVTQQWIKDNGIDKNKVFLQRWSGSSWDTLSTNKVDEDDINAVYEATAQGLSVFAVVGLKPEQAPPTTLPPVVVATTTSTTQATINVPGVEQPIPVYAVVLAILFVIAGAYWFFTKKKK